jgi:predicted dehydrogenase
MAKVALIGVGKRGLSLCAILSAHPDVKVVAICNTDTYLTSELKKLMGVKNYKDARKMFGVTGYLEEKNRW